MCEQEYLSLPNDICFQRCYLTRKRQSKWLKFFGLEFPLLFSCTRGFDPQWTRLPRCCFSLWQISETGETEDLTSKWKKGKTTGEFKKAYTKLSSYSMKTTLHFRLNLYEHWLHGSIELESETVCLYFCGERKLHTRISRFFNLEKEYVKRNKPKQTTVSYIHWRPVMDFSLLGMKSSLTKTVQGKLRYYSRLHGADTQGCLCPHVAEPNWRQRHEY